MHDKDSSPTTKLHPPSLIIVAVLSVIATVIVLESQGKIKHSENKDQFAISEYRAILVSEEENSEYLVSPKPSNQHASCESGFLFIQSDVNKSMKGVVVDYKNRGVRCNMPPNSTDTDSDTTPQSTQ